MILRKFLPLSPGIITRQPVTLITDPLFYALAVPAVIALGLSKGGFVGVGQMATPVLALVMPPLEAAAIFLPIMIAQDAAAVWVYRKDWSRRIVAIVLPGAVLGVGAAWLLAAHISDAAVRVFIGVTTIAFVLYNWFGPRPVPHKGEPPIAPGLFWGSIAGFTSTICQAGGPPYQMYVLGLTLPKMVYVSTNAIVFAAMNWMKVVPYFALGQFSPKGVATSAALLPLAMLANWFGFWVVRVTPTKLFYRITLVIMFLISIELVRSGMSDILRG